MPKTKKRRFDAITIFPDVIDSYASESILGRAKRDGKIEIVSHNLRDYTTDKHRTVDDTPYGGGPGMLMMVEPIDKAVKTIRTFHLGKEGEESRISNIEIRKKTRVILTTASAKQFTQIDARRLAKYDQLIFICGRYEGVDQRVEDHIADESFSIGEYVLTGGELPALVMIDAIARHVPGVLGSKESLKQESHDEQGLLEYPQYTKPEMYQTWNVPPVLLSGDHKKIEQWREDHRK